MPNLFVHAAVGYLIGTTVGVKDLRLIIIGALIPDISRMAFLALFFSGALPADIAFFYTEPIHTIFFSTIASLLLCTLFDKPKKCFLLLAAGFMSHYILDTMQIFYGYGTLLLYPISFHQFSLSGFHPSGVFINSVGLLFFIAAFLLEKKSKPTINFSNKSVWKVILILAFLVTFLMVLSSLTKELFIQNNVRSLDFLNNSEKYEGQEIELHDGIVVSTNPVVMQFLGKTIKVSGVDFFREKEIWSVKGVFRNGELFAEDYFKYNTFEFLISATGILMGLLFWRYNGMKGKA